MKRILPVALVALLALVAACAARAAAQELAKVTQSLQTSDGRTRNWDVYGSTEPSEAPRPVLLVFHGGASTKEAMPPVTCPSGVDSDPGCLNRLAALGPENYLVVYPQGFLLSWNAGNCCGPAMANAVDDVAFVAQLLDRLEADFGIDERRVYATGFSNGAMLTHRLACELADRIAAIAPVSGGIGISDAACAPARPVPVLELHGTADENYPYGGGMGGGISGTDFVGIPETIAGWAARDGCAQDFAETQLPNASPEDGTMVFRDSYRDCDAEVLFFRIADGGHTWPNGSPNLTTAGFGVVSRDVDANREMLEFFARHPTSSRSGPRPPASPGHATREIGR